jgi:hypothetical protein
MKQSRKNKAGIGRKKKTFIAKKKYSGDAKMATTLFTETKMLFNEPVAQKFTF